MSQKETRRRYSKEFKCEAVQLVQKRDGQITAVASSLGIHPNMLHRWVKEYGEDPSQAFPGNGNLKTQDDEIRQLKKKLRDTEEERDILKKALSIFSHRQT